MSTITLRNVKGTALTWQEVDNNFTNLNTDKLQSENAGTTGQILTRTATGAQWANAAGGGLPLAIVNGTITLQQFTNLEQAALTENTLEHLWSETYDPNNLVTVSGDSVTISAAGTYLIEYVNPTNTYWYAGSGGTTSSSVPEGTIKLYNSSDNTTIGTYTFGGERHSTSTSLAFTMRSGQVLLSKIITIASSKTITLRRAIGIAQNSWFQLRYVYTIYDQLPYMKITKLS